MLSYVTSLKCIQAYSASGIWQYIRSTGTGGVDDAVLALFLHQYKYFGANTKHETLLLEQCWKFAACGLRYIETRAKVDHSTIKAFNYLLITHTFHCGGARHCGPVTADSVRFQMCSKPRVNVGKSSGGSCSLCWWWFDFGAVCSCWHLSYEKWTITSSCWYRWWSKSSAEGFLTLKNANTLFPSKCRMSQIWRYMYPLIGRYFQKPINRRILCQ